MTPDTRGTYLYAVVRASRAPELEHAPRGLAGAGLVRALELGGGTWLIVADVPLSRYGAGPIGRRLHDLDWVSTCAMAHEAVVEHFASAAAIVPGKLYTIFRSDERALEHVRRRRAALERLLDRVAGRTEFGIRVTIDEARGLARAGKRTGPRVESGTTFLRRKGEQRRSVTAIAGGVREAIRTSFATLARHADAAIRRPGAAPGTRTRLVLDAAFLVRSARVRVFEAAVERVATRLGRDGCQVTLTGPWPPYNFVGKPR